MLITNANIITWGEQNQVLTDHAILIQDGLIQEIGATQDLIEKYPTAEMLDARHQWVLPGNICAHTHFYGAYARGMAIPGDPPKDFPEILSRLWWNLDKSLDEEAVRASAEVALVDAIKHGTTSLIDHHASPTCIDGSLDIIAEAVEEAGVRAVLCYEVTDRDGMDDMHAGIDENLRFIEKSQTNPLIRGTFGLHASLTLNDETLQACAKAATDDVGFHIHVAEHEVDEQDSLSRSGKRVVQRLDEYGIWRENTIAAHCVHINEAELDLLQQRGVWITHQPRSNMNNAVGAMALDYMLEEGIPVCLGNDGMGNNMWAEWKAAYFLHKVANRDPRLANGADIARMATVHNARLLESFFPEIHVGEICEGAVADLIFIDYLPYTPLTSGNVPWHVIFGFEASMITTTIVAGKILMRDRVLLTLDERAIAENAMQLAGNVWEKYTKIATNDLHS